MIRLSVALPLAIAILVAIPCQAQWQQVTIANADGGLLQSGGYLFLTGLHGVFRSSDDGTSWTAANSGLGQLEITSSTKGGSYLFIGQQNGTVHISTNNGDSWVDRSAGLPGVVVNTLAHLGSRLWVNHTGSQGTHSSTNDGVTWQPVPGLSSFEVKSFAVGWGKLFAGCSNMGVYLSTDDGITWTASNNGLAGSTTFYVFTILNGYLFVGTNVGVFRSTNEGATWTSMNASLGGTYDILPVDTFLFAATYPNGLFLSTDYGVTWVAENEGWPPFSPPSLATSGSYLLAGISQGVWRRPLAEMLPGDPSPRIEQVTDNPGDQGGQVRVLWSRSYLDTPPSQTITEYRVWRGVRPEAAQRTQPAYTLDQAFLRRDILTEPAGLYLKWPASLAGTDTIYWEYVGSNPAQYFPAYSFTAPTPSDSGPQGTSIYYFCVSAQTSNPFVFYLSNVDSGYSIDNLSPAAPQTLSAILIAGPAVNINWRRNSSDPDVGAYEVYRDTVSGFTPSATTKIGQTTDSVLIDTGPTGGANNYYRVLTVDVHGNRSTPSVQVGVAVCPTLQYDVAAGWNLVSVPLSVLDYSKQGVFPTATTDAFAYQGTYVPQTILRNGVGYWLKFGAAQQVPMAGFLRDSDTVLVQHGWNLIGSTSSVVPVGNVITIPAGIVISPFYGYSPSGYSTVSTIDPAKGYWVKSNGSGVVVLSGSGR